MEHGRRDQPKLRLDELLVARGLFASRSRARDAVARGTVTVAGETQTKPGRPVAADAPIAVSDEGQHYVSRAALKLIAGLDAFGLDPAGREALDLGASTGGFTQVLLERGAAHVTALDVGHGQLHPTLRADRRVTVIEGFNARELTAGTLGGRVPDFITADVSFITLRLVLPPALALVPPGAVGVFLVKPQFEAGRDAVGKTGLLRDPAQAPIAAEALRDWLDGQPGWRALGLVPSPIEGGDGNREFLLGGVRRP